MKITPCKTQTGQGKVNFLQITYYIMTRSSANAKRPTRCSYVSSNTEKEVKMAK